MGGIDWVPIADLPNDLKDGRDVLLFQPSGAVVGSWGVSWETNLDAWVDHGEGHPIDNATHFAEITPPTP